MKVLVSCEFSGTVRDAFIKRGHEAISCDLLPTEAPGPHIQADVMEIPDLEGFDLMIAHPPCTYLCVSGLHWNTRIPGRQEQTEKALAFVRRLLAFPISRIALENPVGCISTQIRKADQIIQPWEYGHPESKATCLWLKGLPLLVPSAILQPTEFQANGKPRWLNQTGSGQSNLGPSKYRWKLRSKTYQGIGEAMAEQWGNL